MQTSSRQDSWLVDPTLFGKWVYNSKEKNNWLMLYSKFFSSITKRCADKRAQASMQHTDILPGIAYLLATHDKQRQKFIDELHF